MKCGGCDNFPYEVTRGTELQNWGSRGSECVSLAPHTMNDINVTRQLITECPNMSQHVESLYPLNCLHICEETKQCTLLTYCPFFSTV